MARKEVTQFFDDVDGKPLDADKVQTIDFSFKGTEYTIDLSSENALAFSVEMDKWINNATKVTGRRRRSDAPKTRADMPLIRQWAVDNGYKVSDRGRVPKEIVDAYDKR